MNLLVRSYTEFGDGEKAGQIDEDSWWDMYAVNCSKQPSNEPRCSRWNNGIIV